MKFFFVCIFFVFACASSYAQVCTGSLGDPIVKIDFGANPDPANTHNANKFSDITTYTYTADLNVEDGYYSVKKTTNGDHPNGWWQTGDHTGDLGGYMMVVNASPTPGEFFRKKVTGLCANTTYEFAAWVLNLLKSANGTRPNLTFIIESADGRTKTFETGDIPNANPNWTQYGTFFETSASSGDVTIIIKNNTPGGSNNGGNDLALDDITFRACSKSLVSSSFANSRSLTVNSCVGDNVSYTMSTPAASPYTDPAYQWQVYNGVDWDDIPGATNLNYTAVFVAANAGSYRYRVATAELAKISSVGCRVYSNELVISVNPPPSVNVVGPAAFCEGSSIVFECATGDSYEWTFPNGTKYDKQGVVIDNATLADAGTYTVKIHKAGCVVTTSHNVTVVPKTIANAGPDQTVCLGSGTRLNATGGTSYTWSPATGLSDPNIANPTVTVDSTITYTVLVKGAGDCSATDAVTIFVDKPVVADAGPDRTMFEGDTLILKGSVTGRTFYWSPATGLSDPNSLRPTASPTDDITYTLYTSSGSPCNYEATDKVFVRVYKTVVIPNTFTPNGDGINDLWNIKSLITYPTAVTQVFNRQGALMYQTQGYSKPWDGVFNGKPLPTGVYYYKIDLKIGTPVRSGWISLLR